MSTQRTLIFSFALATAAILLGQWSHNAHARMGGGKGDGGVAGGSANCATAPAAILGANPFDTTNATVGLDVAAGGGCDTHTMFKVNYFTFTPSVDGMYVFSTCDEELWDTRLAVFSICGASQVPLACNDDACNYQSQLAAVLTANTTYRLAIGGYGGGDGGAGTINITFNSGGGGGGGVGPDVIVGSLSDIEKYGSVVVGGQTIMAYAIGTTSCNIGNALLDWFSSPDNRHPFIPQNMYRIKGGRIEQIGMGWGKHGFYALQDSLCGPCIPSPSGTWLGVGCSDPYGAGLNGSQGGLGTRTEVNAATGIFPGNFNAGMPAALATIGRRVQVNANDLNPTMNPGAVYLCEGQYIHAGDAAAGNDNNNGSWRSMTVGALTSGAYLLTPTGATNQQQSAINAWRTIVPAATIVDIDVEGDGRFTLGYNVTDIGSGKWHYEYAIQNINSDRGGRSFSVPVPAGAIISNVYFKDVNYHSGDAYAATDWTSSTANNAVTWTGGTYATSANGNALRFATLYNFAFDANFPPANATGTLGLFKPGALPTITVALRGPAAPTNPADLNSDQIINAADLAMLLNAWGTAGPGDINASGSVDAADLAALLSAWTG